MANIFIAYIQVSSTKCRGENDNSVSWTGRKESGEEMRFKLDLGFAWKMRASGRREV